MVGMWCIMDETRSATTLSEVNTRFGTTTQCAILSVLCTGWLGQVTQRRVSQRDAVPDEPVSTHDTTHDHKTIGGIAGSADRYLLRDILLSG
jgi:ABC-type hemin transport system ATPase subunit